jgi:hypothetical protein
MAENRRFPPPWTVVRPHEGAFAVKDANSLVVATVHCRDDLQRLTGTFSGSPVATCGECARFRLSRVPDKRSCKGSGR